MYTHLYVHVYIYMYIHIHVEIGDLSVASAFTVLCLQVIVCALLLVSVCLLT